MASDPPALELQGVVRYNLSPSGNEIEAKWVSSRMVSRFRQAGFGKAVRLPTSEGDQHSKSWEGAWEISYFEPDGKLAITPFRLVLSRDGDIFHGTWAVPSTPDKPILSGFGFEEEGKLYMRYGN